MKPRLRREAQVKNQSTGWLLLYFYLLLIIAHQTTIIQCYSAQHRTHRTEAYKLDELDSLLSAHPDPRNRELVRSIRAAQLDHRIFYPEQLQLQPGDRLRKRESAAQATKTSFFLSTVKPQSSGAKSGARGRASKARAAQKDNQVVAHYNRTNVVIKAFNYRFRLDLELNNNLFGPGLIQKHFLAKGVQQISTQKLEHCYYHARTPTDTRPAAIGAFRTCNGLSGIIHANNESFVIHPFYDVDLSVSITRELRLVQKTRLTHAPPNNAAKQQKKHPHIIYRYQPTAQQQNQASSAAEAAQVDKSESVRRRECGNSRLHEWALRQYNANSNNGLASNNNSSNPFTSLLAQTGADVSEFNARTFGRRQVQPASDRADSPNCDSNRECRERQRQQRERFARDVSLTEKYIELALVLSQDMFDKRNASQASPASRLAVLHDAIQIINCLDLYFSSASTRVSLIYIETWAFGDQIEVSPDVRQTLYNFLEYSTRKLYKVSMDAAHLLTGGHLRQFDFNEIGMSIPDSVCTSRAVSVSQEPSIFEPFLAASTMAHMLGHNLGMEHDSHQQQQQQQEQPLISSYVEPMSSSTTLPSLPITAPTSTSTKNPAQVHGANHGLEEDPEDEIKSRSVSSAESAAEELMSVEEVDCRQNCLMSDHFVHLQPPVSFASLVRKQANSSTLLTTLNVAQDFASEDTGEDADQLSIVDQSSLAGEDNDLDPAPPQQQQQQQQHPKPILQITSLPFRFSRQSIETYRKVLRLGQAICLLNKPNQLEDFKTCGNGIVDRGEDCDCGSFHECSMSDSCCDPITCRFRADAECIEGACCDRCHLRPRGHVCRRARGECDLAEVCDGKSGQCQPDVHKQNGHPCAGNAGFCYLGQCPTHEAQCQELWGSEARRSDRLCYANFNLNGTIRGNCGTQPAAPSPTMQHSYDSLASARSTTSSNNKLHQASSLGFKRCEQEHMMCGTLQCQLGDMKPVTAAASFAASTQVAPSQSQSQSQAQTQSQSPSSFPFAAPLASSSSSAAVQQEYSKKVVHSLDGQHHECKVVIGAGASSISYVRDGSKCGSNKVCLNQTCQPLKVAYRDSYELCPHDERGRRCAGNGICSTANRCHCDSGWQGHDCSQRWAPSTVLPPIADTPPFKVPNALKSQEPPTSGPAENNLSSPTTATSSTLTTTTTTQPSGDQTTTTTTPAPTELPIAPVPNTSSSSSDKPPAIKDSARPLVFILVCAVAAVFVGFALMANCYRRKGFLKPDKVLRHHQMNCKLDAIRSSFIAKRLADAAGGVGPLPGLTCDETDGVTGGPPLLDLMHHHSAASAYPMQVSADFIQPHPSTSSNHLAHPLNYYGGVPTTSHYATQTQTMMMRKPMAAGPQRQFAASVHYPQHEQQQQLDASRDCYRQRSVNMDSFEAFDAQADATGDHVPLLMSSTMEPASGGHHTIQRRGPPMRSFVASRQPTNHYSGEQRADRVQVRTGKGLGGGNPMNRTSSLGNVHKQCQHNPQRLHRVGANNTSSSRLRDCCSREALDDEDTFAAHKILATPSRAATSGCTPSCWQPQRSSGSRHHIASAQQHLELDSCSAPSSPERHVSEWSDTIERNQAYSGASGHKPAAHRRPLSRQSVMSSRNSANQAGAANQQNSGYHEDYVFSAINTSQQRQRQQSFANINQSSTSTSLKRQQQQVDGDTPPLPAPPPPPPAHLFEEQDSNVDENEVASDDNQRDSDYYTSHPQSGSKQSTARSNISANWPNVRTVHRVPLNDGETTLTHADPRSENQSNLTLIGQLQQLAHVRSVHQKQVAGRASTSSSTNAIPGEPLGDLHEFFSLPLSIQLSALLARSLRNENSLPQVSTPIDDYLNNLNNSSVAASSRRSFKRTQGANNLQQSAGQSSRQQVKLQNLQELINRLQKLHSQTMMQQQRLNELDDNDYDEDDDDGEAPPGHKRRPPRLTTKSQQSIHGRPATVDDMFVPAGRVATDSPQSGKWIEGSSQSLGRASKVHRKHSAGSSLVARTSMINESVYSMSDSEDGVFVARMLVTQQGRQVRKKSDQRTDSDNPPPLNNAEKTEDQPIESVKQESGEQASEKSVANAAVESQGHANQEVGASNSASPHSSSATATEPHSVSSQMSTFKP